MKMLGLIGGMSWESTLPYYRYINETIRQQLGGLHSARLLLASLDFAEIAELQKNGQWDEAGQRLANAARQLAQAGAEGLVLCTNTMHKVADAISNAVDIPLLHIVDPTGEYILQQGYGKVGLLGTRFTMEQPFYTDRLLSHYEIECVVPDAQARDDLHRIIFSELCQGMISDTSRQRCKRILQQLAHQGAEGIILGCTELSLLIHPEDSPLPLFDTTRLHAEAAARWSLA
ncbi:aspartate/glutamate racemase family protein [Leeia oryzae]|uniref:aspartate/glutamate racemase family protein n=1 Tax=Leeia oryzae TaxID=356662 RepID=UPI0003640726|nr:aspartate/glutamate racemase family protein [Leeia oryzae]